ncbi:PREDICTED: uncharacterized protein LOC105962658 [Erythranthe guttata]|uniref:uncharacterized protein LOC105962658 n=1 Tax=Erythranthe guttata TaxID=4155 RepID=UPI00064DC8B4|nr:PREDICTED: uncharacterized protein LOC105962658 [Erythranthe guttata]|eukprot:XP_012842425.1 PREDICTED: uncharacterized protein LOC105962658 [Erythranthe guttata]
MRKPKGEIRVVVVLFRAEGRRFRMRRPLFCRILNAVESYDPYFVQRHDAIGVRGLSSLQKVIAALRILAYGIPADLLDDHIRIGQSTSLYSLRHFVEAIVVFFSEVYLRTPTETDLSRLLQANEQRGFPGILGSIDCMHWEWKKFPTELERNLHGHSRSPTIVLEAVASGSLDMACFFKNARLT